VPAGAGNRPTHKQADRKGRYSNESDVPTDAYSRLDNKSERACEPEQQDPNGDVRPRPNRPVRDPVRAHAASSSVTLYGSDSHTTGIGRRSAALDKIENELEHEHG
jgi:hypothetical protein